MWPSNFSSGKGTFQRAANGGAPFWFGRQGKKRATAGDTRWNETLGGPVHDFPITQIAPTAEGDCAGPDAAQRQGDAFEVFLVVPVQDRPGAR